MLTGRATQYSICYRKPGKLDHVLICIAYGVAKESTDSTEREMERSTKILQMKVREIEMILSKMGAIDPDNPQESLGENEMPINFIGFSLLLSN